MWCPVPAALLSHPGRRQIRPDLGRSAALRALFPMLRLTALQSYEAIAGSGLVVLPAMYPLRDIGGRRNGMVFHGDHVPRLDRFRRDSLDSDWNASFENGRCAACIWPG